MSTAPSPDPRAAKPAAPQPEAAPPQGPPASDFASSREQMVLAMMVLVAAAAAAFMRMHFNASLGTAVLTGFITWASFMIVHLLVRRSNENGRMRLEILRLEHELAKTRSAHGLQTGKAAGPASHEMRGGKPAPRATEGLEGAKASPMAQPASIPPAAADAAYTHAPINVEARWEPTPQQRAGARQPVKASLADAGPERQPVAGREPQSRDPLAREREKPHAGGPAQRPAPSMPVSASAQPMQQHAAPPFADPARPQLIDAPAWSGASVATVDPLQDAWSFRPRDAADARIFAPDAEPAPPGVAPPGRPLEADLELVQRKIKALADEVNAAEAMKQSAQSLPVAESSIDHSVAALRSTAGQMRSPVEQKATARTPKSAMAGAQRTASAQMPPQSAPSPSGPQMAKAAPGALPSLDALIPATAERIAVSAPRAEEFIPSAAEPPSANRRETEAAAPPAQSAPQPPAPARSSRIPAQTQRIQEIAAAIEAGRMDVFLTPIVGLGDYAVSHFEVAVRLKSANGATIERPEQILDLGARDILALFDIERLTRAAAVAAQLEQRGKTGSILSPTSGHAMTDAGFLEVFAHTFETRTSIANQLVLTFTQADVASFGAGTWQALDDMRSFGFRFALEHVTHLGIDFAELTEKGFVFVKLPADAFLAGMAAEGGFIPAADICKHISGAGLTLVVEGVNDDKILGRVFGFGALFGQGQLFGGSREISLEALGPKTAAA